MPGGGARRRDGCGTLIVVTSSWVPIMLQATAVVAVVSVVGCGGDVDGDVDGTDETSAGGETGSLECGWIEQFGLTDTNPRVVPRRFFCAGMISA